MPKQPYVWIRGFHRLVLLLIGVWLVVTTTVVVADLMQDVDGSSYVIHFIHSDTLGGVNWPATIWQWCWVWGILPASAYVGLMGLALGLRWVAQGLRPDQPGPGEV
jgi:hypothetical protein